MSVRITTRIPSPEEVADGLGLSAERRKFHSELASHAKPKRAADVRGCPGANQKAPRAKKRSKAA